MLPNLNGKWHPSIIDSHSYPRCSLEIVLEGSSIYVCLQGLQCFGVHWGFVRYQIGSSSLFIKGRKGRCLARQANQRREGHLLRLSIYYVPDPAKHMSQALCCLLQRQENQVPALAKRTVLIDIIFKGCKSYVLIRRHKELFSAQQNLA